MKPARFDVKADLTRAVTVKVGITALLGVVVVLLLARGTQWMYGPEFWRWEWRRLPVWPLFGLMALGLAPLLVGHMLYRPGSAWRTVLALVLAMCSCYAMKLAAAAVHTSPMSLDAVSRTVEDRFATSYYTDAAALHRTTSAREWLRDFPQRMSRLNLHSKTKAPGPILFYTAFIERLGESERTAMIAGLVVGAIGTLSIPAAYLLIKMLARDASAGMCGATFLALCPGFVLFFPMFDPAYILLSSALIGSWVIALERPSRFAAVALGVTLALTGAVSFNVLVIGLFMAAYPLFVLEGPLKQRMLRTAPLGAIAVATAAVLLLILQKITGYDAFSTFASAWRNQQILLETYGHTRLYPQTIPFDLTDFALGSGWVSVAVIVLLLLNRRATDSRQFRIVLLCLAQPVAVAITGLLQLETARVWNFMLPLLMLPIGLELRTWPTPARVGVYLTLCLVTAAVAQNVRLIY